MLERRVSPLQQQFCLLIMVVCNVLLMLLPLASEHFLALFLLCNLLGLWCWRDFSLLTHRAAKRIQWLDERWWLEVNGCWLPVSLVEHSVFRDWSIMMCFYRDKRFWRIYLWPDSAAATSLRQLRVRLLHNY